MDLDIEKRQTLALERIAAALERLAPSATAPNYRRNLNEFKTFDWESIGAKVDERDCYGVASVIWQNQQFKRRSPENAYGAVVFFSRCTGKDEEGRNIYERLITFKEATELKIRPISRKVESLLL